MTEVEPPVRALLWLLYGKPDRLQLYRGQTGGRVLIMKVSVQHEKYNSAPGSRVGTPAYLAPEVVLTTRGKTYNAKVPKPSLIAHLLHSLSIFSLQKGLA